jgi:hypothetical protein
MGPCEVRCALQVGGIMGLKQGTISRFNRVVLMRAQAEPGENRIKGLAFG